MELQINTDLMRAVLDLGLAVRNAGVAAVEAERGMTRLAQALAPPPDPEWESWWIPGGNVV